MYTPINNVWVAASAGSGKTKTLVDRYIGLLLRSRNISEILCITFTKAAAAEMFTRICDKLKSWVLAEEVDLAGELKTILGMEHIEQKLINKARQLFAQIIEDQELLKIQTIHSFCHSMISEFPLEAGVEPGVRVLEDDEYETVFANFKDNFFKHHSVATEFIKVVGSEYTLAELTDEILQIHSLYSDFFSFDKESYRVVLEKFLLGKSTATNAVSLEGLLRDVESKIDGFGVDKRDLKDKFLTKDGSMRKKIIDSDRQLQQLVFDRDQCEKNTHLLVMSMVLFEFGREFIESFQGYKRQRCVLDYSDLISACLKLFDEEGANFWVKYKLSNKIHHLLLDEAQDTNLKQWQILHHVISGFDLNDGSSSIFVVGDHKQSIYSFQGADAGIFLGMQAFFEKHYNVLEGTALSKSFRSDRRLLSFVDSVFANESIQNYHTHTSCIEFPNHSIQIWPLVVAEEDAAKTLANKISQYVQALIVEKNYMPSDFMILVRKRDVLMEHLIKAFKEIHVPVSGADRVVLSKHLAIQDLLNLATFVLFPYDDYNLACLLKSPIVDVSEEKLLELCLRDKLSLWENIALKDRAVYELLSSFASEAPFKFFYTVLQVKKIRTAFLARFGMYVNELLDEFLDIAFKAESQGKTLLEFVDWFMKTKIELKRDQAQSTNEVRIMTVHASKGLEAKVVILPDTTSIPTHTNYIVVPENTSVALYSQGEGSVVYKEAKLALTEKSMQEYSRLLYVALTRAASEIVVCGCSKSEKIPDKCWYNVVKESGDATHTLSPVT